MASTLKMVAEAAGVSIRTAGRALHGDGPVKPEVAERVREAARRVSYFPNAAARTLRSRSSRIVGVISCGCDGACSSESGQTRLRLIEEALRKNHLHVLTASLPESESDLLRMLAEWTGLVRYVIFNGWQRSFSAEKLLALPMHFIFLDCSPEDDRFDQLLFERSRGVEAAVTDLIASGCRHIAHVSGLNTGGRSSGFESAAAKAANPIEIIRIRMENAEFADGYRAGEALQRAGADGVFFDTDRMALGFYRYAHEHHIRIPEELSVAAFDNDAAGAFAIPALTTVAHPSEEAVRMAASIIAADDPDRQPEKMVFPTRLICRESIKKESISKEKEKI